MTGRLRLGKMSIFMRQTARPLPATMATMATITATGWRNAKRIGFMRSRRQGPGANRAREAGVAVGIDVAHRAVVGRLGRFKPDQHAALDRLAVVLVDDPALRRVGRDPRAAADGDHGCQETNDQGGRTGQGGTPRGETEGG